MNKKRLFALVLAGAMLSSFGLAACDNTTGGQTPGEQTPSEQTPGEQTPGEQTPGEQTPGGQTGSTEAQVLLDSLADFETNNAQLTFTGTTKLGHTYSYAGEGSGVSTSNTEIYGQATAVGTDLDFYGQFTEESKNRYAGESETSTSEYLDIILLFKRGSDIYSGTLGAWSDEDNDYKELPSYTFDTALAEFTKADSDNYFTTDPDMDMVVGAVVPLALSGPVLKLVKNLTGIVSNEYAETADGYTISYNLISAGEELLDKAITLVDALDENTATVKDVYNNAITQDLLGKLLKGITAEEVKGLVSAVITMAGASQDMLAVFPDATGSALDYVGACLASTKFAQGVLGSEQALETLPVKDLLDLMGTDKASVLGLLRQIRQDVAWYIAAAVTGFGDDATKDSKFDADVVLNFTKEKVLSSITVDFEALIDGTQTRDTYTSTTKEEIEIHAELTFPETASLKSLKGIKVRSGYQFSAEPKVYTASRKLTMLADDGSDTKTELTRHFTFTFSVANNTLTVKGECQEDASLSFNKTFSCSESSYSTIQVYWLQDGEAMIDGVQYHCDSDNWQGNFELHLNGTSRQSFVNVYGFYLDSVGNSFRLSEPFYTTLEA